MSSILPALAQRRADTIIGALQGWACSPSSGIYSRGSAPSGRRGHALPLLFRSGVARVVPIRRGTAEAARRLVEEGPPFDVERLGLERHHVFVSEREVVFFFEGDSATAAVDALSKEPECAEGGGALARHSRRQPWLAEDRFGWTRTS
jgi:hypothetical protein